MASPVSGIWQYQCRKQRNIFAPELCTKLVLQYQWAKFGANNLNYAQSVRLPPSRYAPQMSNVPNSVNALFSS
ncbi:MAG: hypothetical protein ACRECZ_04870, partial [Methylocella sp.]